MGELAALAVGGLSAGGMATSIAGQVMAASAQREAIKFNLESINKQHRDQEEYLLETAARRRSSNIVAAAKSGVELSGSPLEVLAKNAAETEKERGRLARDAMTQKNLLRSQKSALSTSLGLGVASTLLGGGAQTVALMR